MNTDKQIIDEFTGKVKSCAEQLKKLSLEQFANRVDNLEHNLASLDSQTIRSGLIGITSSGKSSLLNTILGTGSKILKEQSKATTNMIVFCSKAKEPELKIYFDGADTLVKKGEQAVLGESMWKYTSEDENPHNKFSVRFIKLAVPTFMLGEGVELADTPGLDAFGHKEHEDLTLREFLPQANLIIYLSSIRSPMKEADRKIIDKIMDADQRIIFVQTCKGAVLEQKAEGQATRSVQEQLDEYKEKLRESISHYDNLKDSPIVQVETSQAMEYFKDTDNLAAWRQSGLDEFIYVADEANKQIREEFSLLNLRRIVDEAICVNELLSNLLKEDDDKSVVLEQQNDFLAELQEHHAQIAENIEELSVEWDEQMDFAAIYNKYKEEFAEIYTSRYNFNPMHDKKFLAKAETVDQETKMLKSEFLDIIDVAKKRYTRLFKELGLDVRRMDYQKIDKHKFFLPNVQKKNLSDKLDDDKGEVDRSLQYVDKNRYIQDLEGSIQQFFEPLIQHLMWWRQACTFSFLDPLEKKAAAIKTDLANIEKGIALSDSQKKSMTALSNSIEQAIKEVLPVFDHGAVARKIKAYSRFIGKVEQAKVENANMFLQLGNRLFENLFHSLYLDTLQSFSDKKRYNVVLIGQNPETQLDFLRCLMRLNSESMSIISSTEPPFAINAEKSLAHLSNVPIKGDLQDRITFYLLGNDQKSLAAAKKSKLFEKADVVQVIIDDLHRVGSALKDMVERLLFFELIQKHNDKLLFSYPAAAYFQEDKLHMLVTEAISEVNKVFEIDASHWFVHENYEARYGCFSRLAQKITQKKIMVGGAIKEWKELGIPLDKPFSEETLKEQFTLVSKYK